MAVPNYVYLKLKMPGPKGVITVSSSFEHAYNCDVECVKKGEAAVEALELNRASKELDVEILEVKKHHGTFEPAKDTRKVPVDPADPKGKS